VLGLSCTLQRNTGRYTLHYTPTPIVVILKKGELSVHAPGGRHSILPVSAVIFFSQGFSSTRFPGSGWCEHCLRISPYGALFLINGAGISG